MIQSVDTFAEPKGGSLYSRGGEVVVPGSGETAEDIAVASHIASSGMLLGGDLNVITPSPAVDSTFLAIEITNGSPHYQLAKKAQGKSVVHIHNEDIADVDFRYPSLAEQREIASLFSRLDDLITLHQCKQELFGTQKGAWNGVTNQLVFRTPRTANSPSCTPMLARLGKEEGADRVAA